MGGKRKRRKVERERRGEKRMKLKKGWEGKVYRGK